MRCTRRPTPTSPSSRSWPRLQRPRTSPDSNHVRSRLARRADRAIVAIGVEDNLVKGAAGQAIQAFDLVSRPARDGRPRPAAARTMTTTERPVSASSPDLPPVERRAAMPSGFRAGGLAAGIKASGRPELAVVVTTSGPAAAAAVFTPNTSRPRPSGCRRRISPRRPGMRAVGSGGPRRMISTSGSANAATGAAGDADQAEIGDDAGRRYRRAGRADTPSLDRDRRDASAAQDGPGWPRRVDANADRTVATASWPRPRRCGPRIRSSRSPRRRRSCRTAQGTRSASRWAGIAKGVGMIHPRMATMSRSLTDAVSRPRPCGAFCGRPPHGPGTSSRSTATRAPMTRSSSLRQGRRPPLRWGPGLRLPASSALRIEAVRAISRANRRPTARAPARS